MASDVVHIAIDVINSVRFLVAAYQGESKLVVASRQLMRLCDVYKDSLLCLQSCSIEQSGSLQRVREQISDDVILLKEIASHTESISESTANHGVLHNTLLTVTTGRFEKLAELQQQLEIRVATITTMLITAQVLNGEHAALIKVIGDTDGALFWTGHFGTDRAVSFERFLCEYQAYLTQELSFRRVNRDKLATLLRCSLLSDDTAELGMADLLQREVSVNAFSLWLKLFGPLRESMSKAAAVSVPSMGRSVIWFRRSDDREMANQRIQTYVARSPHNRTGERMVIVRYSSNPEFHFVVSTLPPHMDQVQHLPISNTSKGYVMNGDTGGSFAPTLLDCLQLNVFDKLFTPFGSGMTLSRQSLDEWERIFATAVVPLPPNHYPESGNAGAAATDGIETMQTDKACATLTGLSGGPDTSRGQRGGISVTAVNARLSEKISADTKQVQEQKMEQPDTAACCVCS